MAQHQIKAHQEGEVKFEPTLDLTSAIEKNIRQYGLPHCLRDYEHQLRNKHLITNEKIRQTLLRLSLLMLKFLSGIHHIDLENTIEPNRLTFKTKCRRLFRGLSWHQSALKWCFCFLLSFQVYLVARFSVILYYQYSYDFDKIRLRRLTSEFRLNGSPDADYQELRRRIDGLEASIRDSRESLKRIGEPHMEWAILIEWVEVYVVHVCFILLVIVPLYLNFNRCVHFEWVRYFLNPDRESYFQASLIALQVREFIKSSRIYTRSRLEAMLATIDEAQIRVRSRSFKIKLNKAHPVKEHRAEEVERDAVSANQELLDLSQIIGSASSRLLLLKHKSSCQQAMSVALSGALNTILDRSDAWLERLALTNFIVFTVIIIYCVVWLAILHSKADEHFTSLGRGLVLDSFGAKFTLFCSACEMVLLFVSSSFIILLGATSSLDVLKMQRALRMIIYHTIELNEAAIKQLTGALGQKVAYERELLMISQRLSPGPDQDFLGEFPSASSGCDALANESSHTKAARKLCFAPDLHRDRLNPCREKHHFRVAKKSISLYQDQFATESRRIFELMATIETNVTIALLHYRCFSADFRFIKRSQDVFAFIYLYVAGILPPIARLHIPYSADVHESRITVAISVATIFPVFLIAWTFCLIHRRCLDIYKALSSLLSQLVRLESTNMARDYLNIDHQISLLRKELILPQEFSHKYATRLVNLVDLTYSNLLKIEFLISLIMISMVVNVGSLGGVLVQGFLADPFGVFDE